MQRQLKRLFFLLGLLVVLALLASIFFPKRKKQEFVKPEPDEPYISQDVDVFGNPIKDVNSVKREEIEKEPIQVPALAEGMEDLEVRFLDVGQADSILIQIGDSANILIDGGNNADGEDVANYLRETNVSHLDAIVATHPHEDHIGGLDDIMESIPTEVVYMPDVPAVDKPGTKTYESFLDVIEEQGIPIVYPENGDYIFNEGETSLQVISPNKVDGGNLNNYSIVTKLVHGEISMMFTGDAEKEVNEGMMKQYDSDFLHVDVLKAGHHGSRTSTTREWFSTVDPEYVVISCGKGNDYGHPHKEALECFKDVTVYRTDMDGTVICRSNGSDLTWETKCTGNVPFGD